MFGKELIIKKYPYLAFSPNIMEYFGIIGYQESFVPKILDSYRKQKNDYPPKIISSITSTKDFGMIDNNLIINQVYPDNPLTILINKNDINQEPPPTSKVIYSFCFDSTDGKTKIFYICFAYKFYERYKYYITSKNYEEYFIPKAFCIISQNYYFSFFDYICKNIYSLLNNRVNNIPIEITVYNIVNFIPSPINYSLHLDLFSYFYDTEEVDIGQLSGYPYIDFDLSEIFNLLPLNLFLEIYLLTVIEQSMIFFSSNLELLNMVMFIMFILNYPCNDSTYFWHIVSVSKDNFVEENNFVGKIMVSMIGVNDSYDPDFDTSPFGKYHYIVDLDNKKLSIKEGETLIEEDEKNDFENLKYLLSYIQNIIREKDKNIETIFLKQYIDRLKKHLEFVLSRNPEFNLNPKNKYVNFFKTSREIMEQNRKIQEIFYDFNLNLLTIFYQDFSLTSSFDKLTKDKFPESIKRVYKLRETDENTEISDNEKFFCYLFRMSFKYKVYFENFIYNFESIDFFKVPLYFSEEFINIKNKDISNKLINKLSLFNIIDSMYYPANPNNITINLNGIYTEFLDKLKKYFKQFQTPENQKIINGNQLMVLNKKIINKYIFLLNNLYDKELLKELFPSIKIQEEELISSIDRRSISNIIQNYIEQRDLIELPHFFIYALVYVFAISLPLHSFKNMQNYLDILIQKLSNLKLFLRHHIYILIKTIYKFYFIHKKNGVYPDICISNIKIYFFKLINFLTENLIVPNEEMMKILNHFFGKIINKERDSFSNKKGKEIDEEANFEILNNVNFICFMKHCFTSKKVFKPNTMVKAAMKERKNCNVIIRGGKKQVQPTVEIKIRDYVYSSDFFAPKKVYKLIQQTYNDFFDNSELDMEKLKIKNVRDVIANLILYGVHLNSEEKTKDLIPIKFLIYTLYLFKNHEKKYGINNN